MTRRLTFLCITFISVILHFESIFTQVSVFLISSVQRIFAGEIMVVACGQRILKVVNDFSLHQSR